MILEGLKGSSRVCFVLRDAVVAMHSDRNAKIQSGSLIGSLAIEAIIGSMNSGRSFHCGGSDKSTGQQSERLGDFHMGLISARQFSIFVRIDKKLPNRGARVVATKYESRRLSFRLSGREKLPVVPAEYRPRPPRN